MDEVEELIGQLLSPARALQPAERLSYRAAMLRHAGVDAFDASEADLLDAAMRHGITCETQLERDAKLDLLMGLVVGPRLGRARPCFVCDYPASQAALARLKPGTPSVAARFELYVDGLELANGFHELVQPQEQRTRFLQDLKQRAERSQIQPPLDENLLAALEHGMPECAGVALGFDRLVAIALGADRLADALSFSIDNA
jgi:lysyl-tRNA synthetase class 2